MGCFFFFKIVFLSNHEHFYHALVMLSMNI